MGNQTASAKSGFQTEKCTGLYAGVPEYDHSRLLPYSERLHLISGRRNFARYSQNIKHLYLRQEARIVTVRASFFAKTNRFLSIILSQKIMMKERRLHECNNHADMFPAVSWRTAIQLDYTALQFKRIPYRL